MEVVVVVINIGHAVKVGAMNQLGEYIQRKETKYA